MYEVLNYYKPKIEASNILQELSLASARHSPLTTHQSPLTTHHSPLTSHHSPLTNHYFLVSTHREENVDNKSNLLKILQILNKLAEDYKLPVIVSTHPRTRKRLENMTELEMDPLIRFLKPFGFLDYVNLQMNALCTLSDSGTISEESAILNFPAISLRQSMERPEAQDAGTIILSGFDIHTVLNSVSLTVSEHKQNLFTQIPFDYQIANTSWRVLKLITGNTNLSNRWHGINV
jgi:UDP-N-acetylglucosamine 2-epimerase (non-hydrolysing)